MKSSLIRKTFLDYFEKNDHKILHSSSLVPENDPTLMFANSGMVQFKNIFTGKEKNSLSRAVTAQKCVRAGGKHNDLENVGYTARHHTFFEMLGNFSFGDYFKDIAIELAWNLITKEFQINKDRLLVTVYDQDEDAYNLWKKIAGLSDDKIIKINTSDNFWSMGETGPCGPCSEIFYDHGDSYYGGPPGTKDENGDRFIEIWNLVFMQFEQINKEKRINLPKPSIDTGMGLERVAALLSNTNDNYQTDIFIPLINKSIDLSNNDEMHNSDSHKVIADHLRSSAFLISDGVLPSNEGRGYVLRRIMRRGMRHAHSLGNVEPVFHRIFPTFLKNMKDAYPELERAKDLIINILLNEETKFKQTIDNGLKILEDEIKNTKNKIFSGEVAFKLYDTYGFPLDLTQDYLKNKSINVDIKTFEQKMVNQKDRARKNWKGTGDKNIDDKIWIEATKNLELTEFIGYKNDTSESIVTKIFLNNKIVNKVEVEDEAILILNKTPFYAESGGQVGDRGFLSNINFNFEVHNTSKIFGNYFLHFGKVLKGNCVVDDIINASIDIDFRNLVRNNHSSTHLLHASLRKILGNHVTQKGSLVNDEKLRFDFSQNDIITMEQISTIEILVNDIIKQESDVKTEILDQEEAINNGAMALFGEKYGEKVRVISMGKINNEIFSIELCGGTHVNNTKDIRKFKIINQSSVASGIRRIEAVTNIGVDNFNKSEDLKKSENKTKIKSEIKKYISLLKNINPNKAIDLYEDKDLDVQLKLIKKMYIDSKQNNDILKYNQDIVTNKISEITFVYLLAKDYPSSHQRKFIDDQKKLYKSSSVITLVSVGLSKVTIIIGVTKDIINKIDANKLVNVASAIVGGKGGGGRKDLAQAGGNLPKKAKDIFNAVIKEIEKLI